MVFLAVRWTSVVHPLPGHQLCCSFFLLPYIDLGGLVPRVHLHFLDLGHGDSSHLMDMLRPSLT